MPSYYHGALEVTGVTWLKLVGGVILVLLGLVCVGQGINLLPGSIMSGQAMQAIIGIAAAAVGAWLHWSVARARRLATRV